ncbi:MAG: glycerophosphodiester phosphodiesterase family protein [Sediminibacterium sp.]|jgi:glycerophosphoryl diester phosphodiesterase
MKFIIKILAILFIGISASCSMIKPTGMNKTIIDYQAHRGGRGLMPENTIPAMLAVMDNEKVTTLEMDLAITKDKQVVVSHDPILNPLITTKPDGTYIKADEINKNIIYQMNYADLEKYDVGLKPHPGFKGQKKLAASIPTLSSLIDSVETKSKTIGRKMNYNIEIKSVEGKDITEHPAPDEFVELVVNILEKKNILDRTSLQSFDLRPLRVLHEKYPSIKTSYLVFGADCADAEKQIALLGFQPTIYSPEYKYVNQAMIDYCHQKNIQIIPWTVNTKEEINTLVQLKVDGIITDYPNLY